MRVYTLLRRLLFMLDAETVHEVATDLMAALCQPAAIRLLLQSQLQVRDPVKLFGVRFPNRVGLAAGFDKNGRFLRAAEALGFGHVEVGAVTPRGQEGNPRPRLFREAQFDALRNRMGFNNDGADTVGRRLAAARPRSIPVGVNLGKNAETPLEEAHRDYCYTLERLHALADFFVINVSSPNTQGLRDLQQEDTLHRLLSAVAETNRSLGTPRPLLLKVSPDLDEAALEGLAAVARRHVQGVVATNTTVRRDPPYHLIPAEGGLSGPPLTARSREVVSRLRALLGPDFPIIGVGGIHDADSARAMLMAGADLVQVYTAFVYEGPALPRRLAEAVAGWKGPA